MREFSTPSRGGSPITGSLTDALVDRARHTPNSAVLARWDGEQWCDVAAATFDAEIRALSAGFHSSGIRSGDRVALMCRTRWEWTLVDYALWYLGAITVPVYDTSSPEQIAWILGDSGAVAVVAETTDHVARITTVRDQLESLAQVWCIDSGDLSSLGHEITHEADDEANGGAVEQRRSEVTAGDLATIIYTSGTTGAPKGCPLTHGQLLAQVEMATSELAALFAAPATPAEPGEQTDAEATQPSTLLFMPLAHVFARIIQIGSIRAGVRLGHSPEVKDLLPDLASFQPTFVLAVPRVFETVFNTISQQAVASGKGRAFNAAVQTAIAWSTAADEGRVGTVLRARHALYDRSVYAHLRNAFGGRCEYAVSGGAPLGARLAHLYRGAGLTVLEGYGLTESAGALTVNTPDAHRIGTVGRPLPGTSVRVSDEGELLFSGPQVFAGYWNNTEASTRSVIDGWIHTGDVGDVDDEGFVKITGRKREILVTAGGKSVSPVVLEDRLRADALIGNCVVVGDGKPFLAAVITVDTDALAQWAEAEGLSPTDDPVDHPDLRVAVQRAVDRANAGVSKAEAIRTFAIVDDEWSAESGHLTPSLKLRRLDLARIYRREIAALYREH